MSAYGFQGPGSEGRRIIGMDPQEEEHFRVIVEKARLFGKGVRIQEDIGNAAEPAGSRSGQNLFPVGRERPTGQMCVRIYPVRGQGHSLRINAFCMLFGHEPTPVTCLSGHKSRQGRQGGKIAALSYLCQVLFCPLDTPGIGPIPGLGMPLCLPGVLQTICCSGMSCPNAFPGLQRHVPAPCFPAFRTPGKLCVLQRNSPYVFTLHK